MRDRVDTPEPLPPYKISPQGHLYVDPLPPAPGYPRVIEEGDLTDHARVAISGPDGYHFGFIAIDDPYRDEETGRLTQRVVHESVYWAALQPTGQMWLPYDQTVTRPADQTYIERPMCGFTGCTRAAGPNGRLCPAHQVQWESGEPMRDV